MAESIILAGSIACGSVYEILKERRGELEKRFPSFFSPVDRTLVYDQDPENIKAFYENVEALAAASHSVRVMRLGNGGIFKALWDLGEELKTGLCVDIKEIPILQETVEICEFADLNPYEEDSQGAVLIASSDAAGLLFALREQHIPAAIIGTVNTTKAKTLLYDGHVRYLDKPRH